MIPTFPPAALLPLIIGVPLLGALACLALRRRRPVLATVLAVGCGLVALAALLAAPDIRGDACSV